MSFILLHLFTILSYIGLLWVSALFKVSYQFSDSRSNCSALNLLEINLIALFSEVFKPDIDFFSP
jgi:hypothetical protein